MPPFTTAQIKFERRMKEMISRYFARSLPETEQLNSDMPSSVLINVIILYFPAEKKRIFNDLFVNKQ